MTYIQLILSRKAKYKAGEIANHVLAKFSSQGRLPHVIDYPPAVVACGKNVNRTYTSITKHVRPEHIHDVLYDELYQLGPIGSFSPYATNSRVGYCAEPNAANQLLKFERVNSLDDIHFGEAYRPRTGVVVPPCGNCRRIFINVVR
jgi:hypothetical protein